MPFGLKQLAAAPVSRSMNGFVIRNPEVGRGETLNRSDGDFPEPPGPGGSRKLPGGPRRLPGTGGAPEVSRRLPGGSSPEAPHQRLPGGLGLRTAIIMPELTSNGRSNEKAVGPDARPKGSSSKNDPGLVLGALSAPFSL